MIPKRPLTKSITLPELIRDEGPLSLHFPISPWYFCQAKDLSPEGGYYLKPFNMVLIHWMESFKNLKKDVCLTDEAGEEQHLAAA